MAERSAFAVWLDRQLRQHGASPAAVAFLAEISAGYLSELRNDIKKNPSAKTVRAIALALARRLGKPEDELLREAFQSRDLPIPETPMTMSYMDAGHASPVSRLAPAAVSALPGNTFGENVGEVVQEANYVNHVLGLVCSVRVHRTPEGQRVGVLSVTSLHDREPPALAFEVFAAFDDQVQVPIPILINRTWSFHLPLGARCQFVIKEVRERPEEADQATELAALIVPSLIQTEQESAPDNMAAEEGA